MLRVTVNVRVGEEGRGHDLEVPAELAAEQLAEMMARALGRPAGKDQSARWVLAVEPSGRILQPNESLRDAAVWDGSRLVLRLDQTAAPPSKACLATLTTAGGHVFRLIKEQLCIGRDSVSEGIVNDVDLTAETGSRKVSRRHLRLERIGGQWYLQLEPDAKHPTTVSGHLVGKGGRVPLHAGDEICIAEVTMIFHIQDGQ